MKQIHFKITEDLIVHLTAIQKDFLKDNMGKIATISMPVVKRSNSQNAYYWTFLRLIEIETGNNSEDLHTYFRGKLLPPKFLHIKGKHQVHEVKTSKSTTELTKIEFGEYLDKISALVDIALPSPEEAGYITNY